MTPEELQQHLDQGFALMADNYPPMWRRMYNNLLVEGFSETESLKLVQTYILAQCPNGIRGDDG